MVEQKKSVIYVPYWIAGAVERNNLPLSSVLDYRKMAELLSAQEQANLLLFEGFDPFSIKTQDGHHIPAYGEIDVVDHGGSITECQFQAPLYEAWRRCVAGPGDANNSRLLANLQTMNSLAWNKTAEQEVAMRFDPVNSSRINHNHPFITYDVEREFVIVVVYPAFFESAKYTTNLFTLCKEVLKVLYVYNTPASGCKTPYFRKYLEMLA